MRILKPLVLSALVFTAPRELRAQGPDLQAASAAIVQSDADFARSVAEKDRSRFLAFIADATTFNGGSANELRGREAVVQAWAAFFEPDGPRLTWTPIKGEVIGAGDLGYTTGRSVLSQNGPDGKVIERGGQYLTVWRKQADGTWKVIFDTGSTLPN